MTAHELTTNFINSLRDLKPKATMPEYIRGAFLELMPTIQGMELVQAITRYKKVHQKPSAITVMQIVLQELLGPSYRDVVILFCEYIVWDLDEILIYQITGQSFNDDMESLLAAFTDFLLYLYTGELEYWKKFRKFVTKDSEENSEKIIKLWGLFTKYPEIPADLVNLLEVTKSPGSLFVSTDKNVDLRPLLAYISMVLLKGEKVVSIEPEFIWKLFLSGFGSSVIFEYIKTQKIISAIETLVQVAVSVRSI